MGGSPIQTVPADPVRAHVQGLLDAGMTQAAVYRAAQASGAIVNALLHGQYVPGRPPMRWISADTAARLMAVEFDPAAVKPKPASEQICTPGARFTPVGFRIGRCADCGQLAPVRSGVGGTQAMFSHPRPESGAGPAGDLPPAVKQLHPDCGTPKGHQRHMRERTTPCELCKAVRRGYEQGLKAAGSAAMKAARTAIPRDLAEAVVKVCRAIVLRRPAPHIRELAVRVVQIADAELCDDAGGRRVA